MYTPRYLSADEKGFGSNAHWWKRLRAPDTLRPYLRIADSLRIAMPIRQNESFEYDPKAPKPIRRPMHADFHDPAWYPYMKDKKIAVDAASAKVVEFHKNRPPVFYKPYNSQFNIIRARNMISEHLARNNLSLGAHIKECDLLPDIDTGRENKGWYDSAYTWNDWNKTWFHDNTMRGSLTTPWKSRTVEELRERTKAALDNQAMIRDALLYNIERRGDTSNKPPKDQLDEMANDTRVNQKRVHWRDDNPHVYPNSDSDIGESHLSSGDEENDAFTHVRPAEDDEAAARSRRYSEWCKKLDEYYGNPS